jgi:endonuclease YncB( thermonuclease family)
MMQGMGKRGVRQREVPLSSWLGRRRWRIRGTVGLVVVALLALSMVDRRGLFLERGDDLTRYDGRSAYVVRVIDGDTLVVDVPDGKRAGTVVRLWGVDTPELYADDPGRAAEAFAQEAKRAAEQLVGAERITLQLEPHRLRGDYGRLLACVELPDGTSLGQKLLERGLARAEGRWYHSRIEAYRESEAKARDAGRGVWD